MSSPIDVRMILEQSLDFKEGLSTWPLVAVAVLVVSALAYICWTDAIATERDENGEPKRDEDGHLIRQQIIPNRVTYPGILLSALLSPVLFENWGMHLVFGVGTFVMLFTVAVIAGGGFGMGDTKLYTMAGFLLGPGVLLVLILAAVIGIVFGVAQAKARGKKAIGHGIPHGPQIAVAMLIVGTLALTTV